MVFPVKEHSYVPNANPSLTWHFQRLQQTLLCVRLCSSLINYSTKQRSQAEMQAALAMQQDVHHSAAQHILPRSFRAINRPETLMNVA